MATTVDVDVDTLTNVSNNDDLDNVKIKDLFVNLTKLSPKSSLAWNYFGFLYFKSPCMKIVAIVQKRLYCKVCFERFSESHLFKE